MFIRGSGFCVTLRNLASACMSLCPTPFTCVVMVVAEPQGPGPGSTLQRQYSLVLCSPRKQTQAKRDHGGDYLRTRRRHPSSTPVL